MSLKLIHLTRKSTSPTKKVAINAVDISYVAETKDSTTLHLNQRGFDHGTVIVTESYDVVLRMWVTALEGS